MTGKATSPHISQITDYLYVSAFPRGEHVAEIVALGVRLVLSMHWMRPMKMLGKQPVELLWLPTFVNIFLPMPIGTLNRGVGGALPVVEDGGGVLVHCKSGKHRSVAQAACVLIAKGYTADEAMQLIKEKRAVADPDAWHIQRRIRKFEAQWQEKNILEDQLD